DSDKAISTKSLKHKEATLKGCPAKDTNLNSIKN
ncbi:hypothetical protein MNBD_DELTA02-148, partial [hydrothermal vent metagenome]